MKKLLTIIVITVFLSACTINGANNDALSDDELFARKKICAELQAEIEARIEKMNEEKIIVWLGKIFYSPRRNSCMYTMTKEISKYDDVRHINSLFDAFTNEKIEEKTGCLTCAVSPSQAIINFDIAVAEYE